MLQNHFPDDVAALLPVLGQRVRTVRARRRWSMEMLAERVGVGRRTVARMEKGDPGIALGVFLTTLWTLGLWETVTDLADPSADKVGEFLEKQRLPERVRKQRGKELDF